MWRSRNQQLELIGILIVGLLLVGAGAYMGMPTGNRAVTHQGKMYINSQSYVEHENIFTQSDAELLALAEDEGWEGTGTVEDPIIISGYSFYAEPTQPVRIWNTDLHWVFANNLVRTSGVMCGFYLTQTT
ncbi:MAG: hypothetical protein ACFFDR_11925, partial [Candidatus Thorarchaeota archaeon]